jgi:DNA-binding beta-propeller fold protein YncE
MRQRHSLILIILLGLALEANAQVSPPLRLLGTTPLAGFEGDDFDHLMADVPGDRLYLAAEDHKTVEIFELRTGKHLRSLSGFVAPHAIVDLPESNKFIVTDEDRKRGVGWIKLISKDTYQVLDTINLAGGADVALFDPATKYCYVRARSPATAQSVKLAIIDTRTFKHIGDITLPGYRSEAMAVEHSGGNRLFVDLTGTKEVGVVDLKTNQVIARWPLPEPDVLEALALDEPHHRVFVAGRKPPRLFVFNTDTGEVVAKFPCVDNMDDMAFDPAHQRIYVTGGPSTSVFEERDPDHYEHIAEIPTGTQGQEGKTARFVPELDRLYVVLSGANKPDAKVGLMMFQAEP